MAQFLEVYKCGQCGNMLEIVHAGSGEPACCGQPAKLQREGVTDAAREKHVPVIEKTPDGYTVKVGSVAHPMEEKHFIQWVELVADGVSYTRFFKPGDAPEATFAVADAKNVYAREYCNLHGHWKADA